MFDVQELRQRRLQLLWTGSVFVSKKPVVGTAHEGTPLCLSEILNLVNELWS